MSVRIQASVPGKVILMGEHAAVYGRPALVAALGRRVRVELALSDTGVELDLRALRYRQLCDWEDLLAYRDRKLEAWTEFRDGRAPDFERVRSDDPAHVVKIALGEVARDLIADQGAEMPPIRVTIDSELPVGSGFGSSAAVAVGIVASCLQLMAGDVDEGRVARLAMEVERRQHGNPSGVDHQTVLRGGILYLRDDRSRPVEVADWARRELTLFDTGAPAESTGEVVAAVRRLREVDPDSFVERLDTMERCVDRFERLLSSARVDKQEVAGVVGGFEAQLESLGVVPDEIRSAIRKLETVGAAAKISGAGSLSGAGGGCLLVFSPTKADSEVERILARYRPIEGSIGASGLSLREVA